MNVEDGLSLKLKVVLALWLTLMASLASASGQQTAEDWLDEGIRLCAMGIFDKAMFDEAIKAFDKAIEINPQYEKAWTGKGTAFALLRDYDDAIRAYDKAIEIDPQSTMAWENKLFRHFHNAGYILIFWKHCDLALHAHIVVEDTEIFVSSRCVESEGIVLWSG
jgi:tetratricopeptide (TPR) repeat protein